MISCWHGEFFVSAQSLPLTFSTVLRIFIEYVIVCVTVPDVTGGVLASTGVDVDLSCR